MTSHPETRVDKGGEVNYPDHARKRERGNERCKKKRERRERKRRKKPTRRVRIG